VCNHYEEEKSFFHLVAEHEFNFRDFLFPFSSLCAIKLMLLSDYNTKCNLMINIKDSKVFRVVKVSFMPKHESE
jgi:hypothetical protein